jgi:TRAP-type uncharacterized transport system substrate-binding protein
MRIAGLFLLAFCLIGCESKRVYRILGNIEDPQNEIAIAIASVLNENLRDSILVIPGIGSMANVDSLIQGNADLAIVDNYSSYHRGITSIMPVYGQILHILHRKNYHPHSLAELIENKKVFAGTMGSGSRMFINRLVEDYGINNESFEFVGALELFEADVIIAFTDLLSPEELVDLKEYTLFSMDDVSSLGKGSLVEGICTRYPQFDPYIIAKSTYSNFTPTAILTVKVDAVLVCRATLSENIVFKIIEHLNNHKQEIATINPLLYRFSGDFDSKELSFELHSGARNYLARYEPSFIEKNAELLGVAISILLALASAIFSLSRWQRIKRKNKIDIYYNRLLELRKKIPIAKSTDDLDQLEKEVKGVQEETIGLVTTEKLLADESFSIFLNLSRFIMDEIQRRAIQLRVRAKKSSSVAQTNS